MKTKLQLKQPNGPRLSWGFVLCCVVTNWRLFRYYSSFLSPCSRKFDQNIKSYIQSCDNNWSKRELTIIAIIATQEANASNMWYIALISRTTCIRQLTSVEEYQKQKMTRGTNLMQQLWFVIVNDSTCFGHLYVHLQECRLCAAACGVQHCKDN